MTTVAVGMSIEDFIREFDEQPFELIDGEKIVVSPSVGGPSYIANKLARLLDNYAMPKGIGEALVETVFVLSESQQWVKGSRVPDMLFFDAEKLALYKHTNPDWMSKPFVLLPEMVVEGISPTDKFADVMKKVQGYLRDGIRMVWVIEPASRTVYVQVAGSDQQTRLTEDKMLSGGNIIPGFEVEIKKLFE